ncbi:MAG TPA: adenylate/guanylate cyclase domain-containing protein [Thermoanaerobaculia bacterium]|nr:adenylate/guanylate cyclase domain-containing protein [Thermoanaerobaculia bacterium]
MRLRWTVEGREQFRLLAGEEVRIGRGTENEVVLPDFSVSRRHASIRRAAGGVWTIEDLGSTNGVQVNRVAKKESPLAAGDRVKIGIFELLVEGELREGKTMPLASAPVPVGSGGVASATIVRKLSDFVADYGLGERSEKRRDLEHAYSSKIFGFLTRLAQMLIRSESIEQVMRQVLEIAFDALPVDRGFVLLRPDDEAEAVCEIARIKDRYELRPENPPVSRTMVEEVMRERVALLTYDALADQRLSGGESIRIHQIRAAMCAPLWSGERIIGVLQLDTPFHAGSFNEQDLDLVTALANYAAVAIERLRYAMKAEFERQVRGRLERYHSPAVIEEILGQDPAEPGSTVGRMKVAEVSVLFADLVGFTALSERLPPAEVADLLGGYFTHATEAIFAAGGTLDKFIGDCVMAFFGAPMAQPDHALRAVRAAIAIQDGIDGWNAERRERGLPTLQARIAVNSGPVVVGDVGSASRVDYTVLGNTVNVASRLEQSAAEPGGIAIGGATEALLGGSIPLEPLGELQLKGLQQRVGAFRVVRGSAAT